MQYADVIRDIGRGRDNPTSLDRGRARELWTGVLAGQISDLELGAVLIALRVKGESLEELAGFMDATRACTARIDLADAPSRDVPVVIPSYNGARHAANLTPLLALLVARRGIPVLVHGKAGHGEVLVNGVPPRVTTGEIFQAMGLCAARDIDDAQTQLGRGEPVFVPIEMLNPDLARVLGLRRILGLRSSAHTLVKMLQPFRQPALRLFSFTHPEYQRLLAQYFVRFWDAGEGDVMMSRGTEGEAVANARRAAQIDWIHAGVMTTVMEGQSASAGELPSLPESREAKSTGRWIQAVVAGERPVPASIAAQVEVIVAAVDDLRARAAPLPAPI